MMSDFFEALLSSGAATYSMISNLWLPAPKFTHKDLPSLSGKVYLVTGGASGIGFELCKALYSKSATVYIAGRSLPNGKNAVAEITSAYPDSKGKLKFIYLDLADMTTVKPAADELLSQIEWLDVVWHNAGICTHVGGMTKQGHELQLAVNTISPWLLQSFLTPLMRKTAGMPTTPKDSVRVIWVSSSGHVNSPSNGGILWGDINFKHSYQGNSLEARLTYNGGWLKYGQSKVANIAIGFEAAKRWAGSGVLSLSVDPGIIKSGIQRSQPAWIVALVELFMYPIHWGSVTYLFAGLSPQVDEEKYNGTYIIPWGRIGKSPRKDVERMLPENGVRMWELCEEACKDFIE